MTVKVYPRREATVLANPGKRSAQLLWGDNAPDSPVTVTRVDMEPGAVSSRHSHPHADQVWIVERGTATMLLDAGGRRPIAPGDVVHTPKGHVHGVENTGTELLTYLTVTCPPKDMTVFYGTRLHGQSVDRTAEEGCRRWRRSWEEIVDGPALRRTDMPRHATSPSVGSASRRRPRRS